MTAAPYPRKLVLQRRISYPHQRSGWSYALSSLEPLLSPDGEGVLLDSMIEKNFCRRLAEARAGGEIPYHRPWVGFVHVPPNMPSWLDTGKSLRNISRLPAWRESLPHCKGFLVLSGWLKDQIRQLVDVPILSLKHPTEFPELKFSFERYMNNPCRRVIQVGWWLRRLCSISELPVRTLRRTMIVPHELPGDQARFAQALEGERLERGLPPPAGWDVEVLPRQPDDAYDQLLSQNLVFLHLHSASVSNAVIECIVRHTPVLVNPVPSLVEYLGESYPFYFQTLEEAASKAEDPEQVRQAHEYLSALPKESLTGEYFCRSLAESDFYRSL
ncbi:MAG TPA: hypothetical protein VLH09_07770 [Bryobacteraceae bacterium]|nr:hypothetical protein [Bryobacteraceae bacterium]